MKTMKYIYTLLLGLLITGLSSCMEKKIGGGDQEAVSYTHLTLPTIA